MLESYVETWPSLHVRDALYFLFEHAKSILLEMEVPEEYKEMDCEGTCSIVMMEDSRLGFTGVEDHRLPVGMAGGGC